VSETKMRAGFSLWELAVYSKNADFLAQWHRKG